MDQKPNSQTNEEKLTDKQEGEYFYFDLADESHEKLQAKELEEGLEKPLDPLKKVTRVEY